MRTLFALSLAGILGFAASLPRPRERSFSFEYAVTVKDIPTGAHAVDVWLPEPRNDAYQRITDLPIDSPYRYETATGSEGNRIVHIRLAHPTQPSFTVTMRFDALRRERFQPVDAPPAESSSALPPDLARYLRPDRLVPLDGTIRKWAREVVDAARRGNCTDFHAIFIGCARAMGIPARFAIGFPLPDVELVPKQHGAPLNYFVYPYVEVVGGKYTALETSYSYKDLPL